MTICLCVGPFPPPVHGMSKNMAEWARLIGARCETVLVDTSPGDLQHGPRYVGRRLRRYAAVVSRLVAIKRRSPTATLYMPLDSAGGLWLNALVVLAASFLRFRIFLHHRSFSYVVASHPAMALIAEASRRTGAVHIFLCDEMRSSFVVRYGAVAGRVLSNASTLSVPIATAPSRGMRPFTVGLLSNLTPEKGLDDFLTLVSALDGEGVPISAILAGPCSNEGSLVEIERVRGSLKNVDLEYRGLVQGPQRLQFYSDIDVFIFPTRYAVEAQPNVLFEAMASASVVVTYDRGCIGGDMRPPHGIVIDPSLPFSEAALPTIRRWLRSPADLASAAASALMTMQLMADQSERDLARLLDEIVSGAETS